MSSFSLSIITVRSSFTQPLLFKSFFLVSQFAFLLFLLLQGLLAPGTHDAEWHLFALALLELRSRAREQIHVLDAVELILASYVRLK